MRKIILTLFIVTLSSFVFVQSSSADNLYSYQHLDPDEFIKLQKEFIKKEANLSDTEATEFFKLYYDLQEKKRINNKKINSLTKRIDETVSDKEYSSIIDEIYAVRQANCKLDFDYSHAYAKVISSKKIYLVMKAESEFRREIVRGIHRGKSGRSCKRR